MELVRYETAKRALAEARSIDEVKQVRDKAVMLRLYAQLAGDFEMQNWAAEIRFRAEIRAGEMISQTERNRGGRPAENQSSQTTGLPPTLAELGITRDQSSTWQMLARIPAGKIETLIARAKEHNEEFTTGGVLNEIAEDEDLDPKVRLRGLAESSVDNRPAKRGTYKERCAHEWVCAKCGKVQE